MSKIGLGESQDDQQFLEPFPFHVRHESKRHRPPFQARQVGWERLSKRP